MDIKEVMKTQRKSWAWRLDMKLVKPFKIRNYEKGRGALCLVTSMESMTSVWS